MTDNQKHAAGLEECITLVQNGYTPVLQMRNAAAYLQALTTINPRSKLPQSPEMVRTERDMLLTSVDALQAEVQRLKAVARGRLRKMRKLRGETKPVTEQDAS